jgi:hypothetical protein
MNYYIIPPTPQEIAEYEEKERKWQEEFNKKIEKMTEDWIRSEFKRLGFDRIDWSQSSTSVETNKHESDK